MKKFSKSETFSYILLLFFASVLCAFFVLPLLTNFVSVKADYDGVKAATEGPTVTISSADALESYIQQYSSLHCKDFIILDADIDMSGKTLAGTIGNSSDVFSGVFNGNGHTISNLNIKLVNSDNETNGYVGLFGNAKDAIIKNICISGAEISSTGFSFVYAGALVARAENCVINHCQVLGDISFGGNAAGNYGALAGVLQGCFDVQYIIVRANVDMFALASEGNPIFAIGTLAGRLINSQAKFIVIESNITSNIAASFDGEVSLGGVVGVISDGNSKLINIAIENSYAIKNLAKNEMLLHGEVIGKISKSVPNPSNISYIHFKQNAGVSIFGDAGLYELKPSYHVSESLFSLANLKNDGTAYFTNISSNPWDDFAGEWSFSSVWYIDLLNYQISLQAFYGLLSVNVDNSTSSVLEMTSSLESSYRYGQDVSLQFRFKDGMEKYFKADALLLNGNTIDQINVTKTGEYQFATIDNKNYEINATLDGFVVTVKNINMSTAGTYSILTTYKTYTLNLFSKIYNESNVEIENVDDLPFVYFTRGSNSNTESVNINNMTYGISYSFSTNARAGSPYAFVGWFLQMEDGSVRSVGVAENNVLAFTFGEGGFDDNLNIFAKYTMNACNITCTFGDGVEKIVFSDSVVVDSSDKSVAVSKTAQAVKLQIYVKDGFNFDANAFITNLDIYKSQSPDIKFCTLVRTTVEDGLTCYQFSMDMTTLTGDFANSFPIDITTSKKSQESTNSFIWWIVGGVAGAVVLAGVVILIVFLARRNKGFGGGSSTKMSRKSFKSGKFY